MIRLLFLIIVLGFSFASCYYDSEEYLYPQASQCDTSNVTFKLSVKPIMDNYCIGCHSGGAPSGNINLEGYNNISTQAANGNLLHALFGTNGVSQMPPGGSLSDCDLKKTKKWVNEGYQNN